MICFDVYRCQVSPNLIVYAFLLCLILYHPTLYIVRRHRARSRRITSSGFTTTCCWISNRNVMESKSRRTTEAERTVSSRSRTPTNRIRATTPVARPAASPTPFTSKFWPVLLKRFTLLFAVCGIDTLCWVILSCSLISLSERSK